jgi:hypothetical protein
MAGSSWFVQGGVRRNEYSTIAIAGPDVNCGRLSEVAPERFHRVGA